MPFTYQCFPGVLSTSTLHIFLTKPLAAFPHNHCRNNERGMNPVAMNPVNERGNDPVAMTIINPWKEYCRGLNQRPPVLKSATLPTDLWGSAQLIGHNEEYVDCSYFLFHCSSGKVAAFNIISDKAIDQSHVHACH